MVVRIEGRVDGTLGGFVVLGLDLHVVHNTIRTVFRIIPARDYRIQTVHSIDFVDCLFGHLSMAGNMGVILCQHCFFGQNRIGCHIDDGICMLRRGSRANRCIQSHIAVLFLGFKKPCFNRLFFGSEASAGFNECCSALGIDFPRHILI